MSQLRDTSRSSLRRSAMVAAVALAFAGGAHANLIIDGGFEGDGVHAPDNNSYGYGSTGIPGWTVIGRAASYNVQWLNANDYAYLNPFQGRGFLDMTGNPDYGPAAVQQSFTSVIGTAYRATFAVGVANAAYGGTNGPVGIIASMGGDFPGTNGQTFYTGTGGSIAAQSNVVWSQFAYDFVATSTSTLLRFEGTFANAGSYTENFIGLDGIDVELAPTQATPPTNGAVPEPAPIALLGLGIIGGVLARRRSKAALPA